MTDPFAPKPLGPADCPIQGPESPTGKPGWQTSEFWLTLAKQIIAILLVTGIIKPDDAPGVEAGVVNGIVAVFALIVAGTGLWKYIQSRIEAKKAEGVKP